MPLVCVGIIRYEYVNEERSQEKYCRFYKLTQCKHKFRILPKSISMVKRHNSSTNLATRQQHLQYPPRVPRVPKKSAVRENRNQATGFSVGSCSWLRKPVACLCMQPTRLKKSVACRLVWHSIPTAIQSHTCV